MLGFLRSEVKKPSAKIMHRIVELEKASGSHSVAACENCQMLLNRVIELEGQLLDVERCYDRKTKAMINLVKSFERFKREFIEAQGDADIGHEHKKEQTSHEKQNHNEKAG